MVARQFDEMEDEYLRERKADLEQVVERLLHRMKGTAAVLAPTPPRRKRTAAELKTRTTRPPADAIDVPLVLIAHDLRPADMLQFKKSVFAGFVTDVGGPFTTAIIARSMDIPGVVGATAPATGAPGRLGDHRRRRRRDDRPRRRSSWPNTASSEQRRATWSAAGSPAALGRR